MKFVGKPQDLSPFFLPCRRGSVFGFFGYSPGPSKSRPLLGLKPVNIERHSNCTDAATPRSSSRC
jgi:hypothetical protein